MRALLLTLFMVLFIFGGAAYASPPGGNGTTYGACTAGNGPSWRVKTSGCPTPGPTSTPASVSPVAPYMNYFGGTPTGTGTSCSITCDAMAHISPTNALKWCYYGQGGGTSTAQTGGDSGGAPITDCLFPAVYVSLNMFEPNTNGVVNTVPWGGMTGTGCPSDLKASAFAKQQYNASTAPDAPDWTSTDPTKNWFMYEGSVGVDSHRIQGHYSTTYTFFTNLNSTELVGAVNSAIHNCSYWGIPLDSYKVLWQDNGFFSLTAAGQMIWGSMDGGYGGYSNWGVVDGSPYTFSTCNGGPSTTTFWNGTLCTGSTQIDSVPITSGNTTYGPDTGSGTNLDSTYDRAWQWFAPQLTHNDGTKMSMQFNYITNGYAACHIMNGIPNVTGGIHESATSRGWGDGRIQANVTLEGEIDVASNLYHCGGNGTFFIHDYIDNSDAKYSANGTLTSVTGAGAIGTAVNQLDVREHVGMIFLNTNDTYPQMMGSFVHGCNASGTCGSTYKSWTDVYDWDFVKPHGRRTPYPAEALSSDGYYCNTQPDYHNLGANKICAVGGAHDPAICIQGTAPNCVFVVNFSGLTTWNYTAYPTGPDLRLWDATHTEELGAFTVILNLSNTTITLSSNELSSLMGSTQWGLLSGGYLYWPGCVPNTSAYSTSAGFDIYAGDDVSGVSYNPTTTNVCTSGAGDIYNNSRSGWVPLSSFSIGTTTGPTLRNGEFLMLSQHQRT